jgi:hypothetical protein
MQTTIKLCGLTKDRMTITVATTPIQGLTIRMTNGEEMDEVSDTTDAIHGLCEKQFKLNGEQLCELMAMCIGLKSFDERTLGDAAVEPYASMKHRKKVNPTQKHMCEEIKRRSTAIGEDTPTCKYWTKEKLLLWLNDNPVSEPDDLLFLVSEEKKCSTLLTLRRRRQLQSVRLRVLGPHRGQQMNHTFACTMRSFTKMSSHCSCP